MTCRCTLHRRRPHTDPHCRACAPTSRSADDRSVSHWGARREDIRPRIEEPDDRPGNAGSSFQPASGAEVEQVPPNRAPSAPLGAGSPDRRGGYSG